MEELLNQTNWFLPVAIVLIALIVVWKAEGVITHFFRKRLLTLKIFESNSSEVELFLPVIRWGLRWLGLWTLAKLLLLLGPWSSEGVKWITQWLTVLGIVVIAWLATSLIGASKKILLRQYTLNSKNNLLARKMYTQYGMIEKILNFSIFIFATGIILMTFDNIRQIGLSLLASAGIVGLAIGFAAQKTLGTVLAGIQVAFTQPIRIDDVVVIEGEWGVVEEINLTYVVIRIWDLRRLVIPINQLIEKPFQNWTRTSSDILGSVELSVDFKVNVSEIREKLNEILKNSPLWSGKVGNLQVTEALSTHVVLRALMSAEDSSKAWDLRCHVREELLKFLQKNHPEYLPQNRVTLKQVPI